MTPVNNNPPPPPAQDPYSKDYGTGGTNDPYGNYDNGGYNQQYDPGMDTSGSSSMGFDNTVYTNDPSQQGDPTQGSGGGGALTVDSLRSQITQEQATLDALKTSNPDLWNKIHAAAQKAIDSAKGIVNASVAKSGDAQMADLSNAETQLGNASGMIGGQLNADGTPVTADGSTGDPNADLKKTLQDYEASINANPNLSADDKTNYCSQIDKWVQGLDSKLLTADSVQPLFEKLQGDISTATAYPPIFKNLSQVTGLDPDKLDAIFKKHGIDPNNLPNPPDSKVADLLNDPDFAKDIAADTQKVHDDYKAYSDAIDKSTSDANSMNTSNKSDTSKFNPDVSAFTHLQGLYDKSADECKNLIGDRKKLATDTATVLSALYGKTVTASTDDAKAGSVSFDGVDLNVCTSSQQGIVAFGNDTKVDWKSGDFRVMYECDCEGDGATGHPPWMDQQGYPNESYDGDNQDHASD